jgi:hypothetical protein
VLSLAFTRDGRLLTTCVGQPLPRVWALPVPPRGDAGRIRAWVRALTGTSMEDEGRLFPLGEEALREERRRLAEE